MTGIQWLKLTGTMRGGDQPGRPRLLPIPLIEERAGLTLVTVSPSPVKAHLLRRHRAHSAPWQILVYSADGRGHGTWQDTAKPAPVLFATAPDKRAAIRAATRMVRGWALGVAVAMAGVN